MAADGSEGIASLVVPFIRIGHFPDAEAVEDDEKYAVGHGGSFLWGFYFLMGWSNLGLSTYQ
jgi:hypothetical protein